MPASGPKACFFCWGRSNAIASGSEAIPAKAFKSLGWIVSSLRSLAMMESDCNKKPCTQRARGRR